MSEPGPGQAVYTWTRARYSKGLEAVKPFADGSGYMTRAQRLADHFARRYSGREKAYLIAPRTLERMLKLYAAGWDASPISGELRPPAEG